MPFTYASEQDNVREIDGTVKNKWRWDWLATEEMKQFLRKLKTPGMALCTLCNKSLKYDTSGKKMLVGHMESPAHTLAKKSVTSSTSLAGYFGGVKSENNSEDIRPMIPINHRTITTEAMVLGFLAEHDLPFTITPDLVKLIKTVSNDKKALDGLTMDRTTASYKMVYGLGETFKQKLVKKVRDSFFSLNIDESTSNNMKKVVAVLISYYCQEKKEVTVCHLKSFDIVKADSETIYNKLVEMFEECDLSWGSLMSVLMDSCAVMRGKRSGVESRIRENKSPHLLDIDGDSVHHAHNAAKAFAKPFNRWVEQLFSDLHTDFKWSSDLKEFLSEICTILNVKFTVPERFLSHRFLSAYNLAVDTIRMLDVYTVFYFSFIKDKKEKEKYQHIVQEILVRKSVPAQALKRTAEIGVELRKKVMTKDGKDRKERIVDHLFHERTRTRLIMAIYEAVLEQLKGYVMMFQMKEPLIHTLHDEQERLLRDFLGLFVKAEKIPKGRKKLVQLELKEENLLPQSSMFIGAKASNAITKVKKSDYFAVKCVMDQLQAAYIACGSVLQDKMPVNNKLLRALSAIDPLARGHSSSLEELKKLPSLVTNVLSEEEENTFQKEIHKYMVDPTLPEYTDDTRIDSWWGLMDKYPMMRKLMIAVLSCFHGPMVEGTFNLMGDIQDIRSCGMDTATLSAIQTVKHGVMPKGAIEFFKREDYLYDPVDAPLVQNMIAASRKRTADQAAKREAKAAKREKLILNKSKLLTKRAARELSAVAAKRARLEHKKFINKS